MFIALGRVGQATAADLNLFQRVFMAWDEALPIGSTESPSPALLRSIGGSNLSNLNVSTNVLTGRTSRRAKEGLKPPSELVSAIHDALQKLQNLHTTLMSGIESDRLVDGEDKQSKTILDTTYLEANQGISDRQVKTQDGRDFNVLNDIYSLPADVAEWDRLDKQHRAITLGLGGLYPAPEAIGAILAPESGVTKRIVDLGCGSGTWSAQMARKFPHCEVLGVDLAPVPLPPGGLPPNCRFEMNDINLGLSHLQDQFHVVFARLIAIGLKDSRKSLADATACLKPGGILIWIDADLDLYSGWPMVHRPAWSSTNPTGSYASRVIYEIRRTSKSVLGSDVETMEKILDEGLWNHATALDPETCKTASLYIPIGPWCEAGIGSLEKELLQKAGITMQQNFLEVPRAASSLFHKAGWSKKTVDRWGEGLSNEFLSDTLGFRLRIAWGRRREGPNLPAPALTPATVSNRKESDATAAKYPLYEVYETQEKALAAAATRNQGKDIPAPPTASESTERSRGRAVGLYRCCRLFNFKVATKVYDFLFNA